jgi:cytochrome b pre-mRNA-processing protein 3
MGIQGWFRRGRHDRAGFGLYSKAVTAARDPYLYAALGAPDTLDGRFDVIGLHVSLLIGRLQALPEPGPSLAQAVFDAMFSDMDKNLREMGVSDLAVGKRVRAMWEALHGRAQAYEQAMASGNPAALSTAIARNVWRGAPVQAGAAEALSRVALAQAGHLSRQLLASFAAGEVSFLPAREAAR